MGIGLRLKQAREAKKLNQRELAEKIGVTPSAITNYENEVSHPKEQVLYKLINVLGVDANFLFQDVFSTSENSTKKATLEEIENGIVAMYEEAGILDLDLTPKQIDSLNKFTVAQLKIVAELFKNLGLNNSNK